MAKPIEAGAARLTLAVREPVRMDVIYHGARFITAEFITATGLLVGLAVLQVILFIRGQQASLHLQTAILFGVLAMNSLTFLLLTREVARRIVGAARPAYTGGWIAVYTIEAVLLLLLPGVFPVLALAQRPRG